MVYPSLYKETGFISELAYNLFIYLSSGVILRVLSNRFGKNDTI